MKLEYSSCMYIVYAMQSRGKSLLCTLIDNTKEHDSII